MPPRTPKTPAKRKAGPGPPSTPVQLRYEEAERPVPSSVHPRSVEHLAPRKAPLDQSLPSHEDLVFMVLDVVEEGGGARFQVWGVTPESHSVCVRVNDFCHTFYIAAPRRPVPATPDKPPSGFDPGVHDELISWDAPGRLERLRGLLNRVAPADSQIRAVRAVHRRPIMYYRPDRPDGEIYLELTLNPSGNARKAGTAIQKLIAGRTLQSEGLVWRDKTGYEYEVGPLQRFLADAPLSGGAWVCIPSAAQQHSGPSVATPVKGTSGSGAGNGQNVPGERASAGQHGGYIMVEPNRRVSTCELEVEAPWRSLVCLTPDATQLADADSWDPFKNNPHGAIHAPSAKAQHAAAVAKSGALASLRLMVLDVCTATRDGKERAPVPSQGDPVVAISCAMITDQTCGTGAPEAINPVPDADERSEVIDLAGEHGESDEGGGIGEVLVVEGPTVATHYAQPLSQRKQCALVFVLAGSPADPALGIDGGKGEFREMDTGAMVVLCHSEAELLLTWQRYFHAADPDIVALFQVGDTLEVIAQRFAALRLAGGGLVLSRQAPACSRPLQTKRITMYSAAWVKSQSRMSSTSNQETFRADIEGRLVVDVLRHCLTACNLASFSLADCVQSLLGQTLEVLGAHSLARLAGLQGAGAGGQADPLRLARYSMRRVAVVQGLLGRLAVIPEAIEMARATGLTVGQVLYNAQMIRTWSLLLRTSQRCGCIIPSRIETQPLTEHTFILHPVEAGTTGLRRESVAILDFASLYPSIYRAYNLCYTTLVHPEDAAALDPEQLTTTPTGAKFVKPGVRSGILPSILAALISARAATRQQLKGTTDPAQRAVLDSRQKALKVTANALYGFTGAQASPLQCVPLADSCLAYGAQSCRKARDVLEAAAVAGRLGPCGLNAKVIYGHTDSLFVSLPRAGSVKEAIRVGHAAAAVVTAAFPPPIELKFERVCAPLMLLHVNRYAGKAFEKEEDADGRGELIVKGLKSMWRQTCPILRTTLHGCLVRILMQEDIPGAVAFAEGQIRRLLTGRVSMHELVMTGGLWRVTGEQVERAAAEGYAAADPGEEVRGPHASLAVRLTQRDPGRSFVLGERLQYVLTGGHKLQDDAAEDPLTAARAGAPADYELYWRNKLQRPLMEIFATCLTQTQLQSLVSGPHTLVKVDVAQPQQQQAGPSGPASPSPGKRKGGRQLGMLAFYRATARCLSCRTPMPEWKGPVEDAPGLCVNCSKVEGRRAETLLGLLHEDALQEARRCAAYAACRQCHSGTIEELVLCDNGECPVTYDRLGTAATLRTLGTSLKRIDIYGP